MGIQDMTPDQKISVYEERLMKMAFGKDGAESKIKAAIAKHNIPRATARRMVLYAYLDNMLGVTVMQKSMWDLDDAHHLGGV